MRTHLLQSNALHIPLADKSVHCVVTSPPYYGLRDYSADGQIGLEPTLSEYIDNMVAVFAEVWRVLRDDGTVWLNMGDSYNSQSRFRPEGGGGLSEKNTVDDPQRPLEAGFKPKDLMMVPHRLAIALQEWGWWVRSDIVWHKPNPMPESVTDRPTKAHEYIFLLSKSKKYFYDADAVREERSTSENRADGVIRDREFGYDSKQGILQERKQDQYDKRQYVGFNDRWNKSPTSGRNKRSVWTITTKPYSGAHFATFPPELPEICIKAGTSEKGVCPECGKPWERVVEPNSGGTTGKSWHPHENDLVTGNAKRQSGDEFGTYQRGKTIGFRPTCSCRPGPGENCIACIGKCDCTGNEPLYETVPAVVLDPFSGSGTTVAVANQLGRCGIGTDLSWEYIQLAKKRIGITALNEWENGRKAEVNLEGLPLFGGSQ